MVRSLHEINRKLPFLHCTASAAADHLLHPLGEKPPIVHCGAISIMYEGGENAQKPQIRMKGERNQNNEPFKCANKLKAKREKYYIVTILATIGFKGALCPFLDVPASRVSTLLLSG